MFHRGLLTVSDIKTSQKQFKSFTNGVLYGGMRAVSLLDQMGGEIISEWLRRFTEETLLCIVRDLK